MEGGKEGIKKGVKEDEGRMKDGRNKEREMKEDEGRMKDGRNKEKKMKEDEGWKE